MTPTAVYDYAAELLALCEACLADSTGGTPDRSFVAAALPALDCCPQLTVHASAVGFDATLPQAPPTVGVLVPRIGGVSLVTYQITIVRCTPQPDGLTGQPPDPAELEAVAAVVDEDVWRLWNCLATAHCNGTLFGDQCLGWYLDNAAPLVEGGGCAGWVIQLRARVQGFTST